MESRRHRERAILIGSRSADFILASEEKSPAWMGRRHDRTQPVRRYDLTLTLQGPSRHDHDDLRLFAPPRSRTQLSSILFSRGVLKITVRDKNKPAELHRRAVVIYSSKNRAAAKASLLMAQEAI